MRDRDYRKESPPPDNFSRLNLYCNELARDALGERGRRRRHRDTPQPVLIFYHSHCLSEGLDLPIPLLEDMCRLAPRTPICAVTHQSINQNLQTFSPTDPNLVSAIVSWL